MVCIVWPVIFFRIYRVEYIDTENIDIGIDKSGKYLSEISKNLLTERYTIRVISTERINKFIDFRSIIHRFQFETIYPQEFDTYPEYPTNKMAVEKLVNLILGVEVRNKVGALIPNTFQV